MAGGGSLLPASIPTGGRTGPEEPPRTAACPANSCHGKEDQLSLLSVTGYSAVLDGPD